MTRLVSALLMGALCVLLVQQVSTDSAGDYDLPGPGLAYGGIPYGSVSGNVAEYFRRGGARYNYKPSVSNRGFSRNSFSRNNFNYDFFSRDFD